MPLELLKALARCVVKPMLDRVSVIMDDCPQHELEEEVAAVAFDAFRTATSQEPEWNRVWDY